MPTLPLLLTALLILLTTFFLRLIYILPLLRSRRRLPPHTRPRPRSPNLPIHLLIVLGSGGHTAEMLSLLQNLDPNRYTHRSYVVSSGDGFSEGRAREFERVLRGRKMKGEGGGGIKEREEGKGKEGEGKEKETVGEGENEDGFSIHIVPRARAIHQSLLTTPLSSLHCLLLSLHLLLTHPHGPPDLILTNGPATSLILILASLILRFFIVFIPGGVMKAGGTKKGGGEGNKMKMRTIYIESWARVKRPSLTGRIIVWCGLCDRVLVQWKGLETGGWGEYRGMLVR